MIDKDDEFRLEAKGYRNNYKAFKILKNSD